MAVFIYKTYLGISLHEIPLSLQISISNIKILLKTPPLIVLISNFMP